jgi:hypothetical protein
MDTLITRYRNFQEFCLDVLPENLFVQSLQSISLDIFIKTIQVSKGQLKTTDEIIDSICSKMSISKSSFKPEQINKFKRYIEYFSEASDEYNKM